MAKRWLLLCSSAALLISAAFPKAAQADGHTVWRLDGFPNPTSDSSACGRPKGVPSWICERRAAGELPRGRARCRSLRDRLAGGELDSKPCWIACAQVTRTGS